MTQQMSFQVFITRIRLFRAMFTIVTFWLKMKSFNMLFKVTTLIKFLVAIRTFFWFLFCVQFPLRELFDVLEITTNIAPTHRRRRSSGTFDQRVG